MSIIVFLKVQKNILFRRALLGWVSLFLAVSSCTKTVPEGSDRSEGGSAERDQGGRSAGDLAAAASTKKIIFAALSGRPPKYIDSGPYRGQGWLEFQTREVRKGLIQDGFQVQTEYMTPARIAHEFRIKSPICFYPVEWNDPKSEFSKLPDRVLSLALNLKGDATRSILFAKKDLPKFKKHLDGKGDLRFESLIADTSLKTVLVRDRDYGWINRKLTAFDEKGDQIVRPEYQRNMSILSIHENRQLLEMLNAGRYDYAFFDSIEDQDFSVSRISQEGWMQVPFESSHVESIRDPHLVQVSVACSTHPTSFEAMPYINRWIAQFRGTGWTERNIFHRSQVDTGYKFSFALSGSAFSDSLTWRFEGAVVSGEVDAWYGEQQRHFPKLLKFPLEEAKPALASRQPQLRGLKWTWKEKGPEVVIFNESHFDFIPKSAGYRYRNFEQMVWPFPYDKLAESFSPFVGSALKMPVQSSPIDGVESLNNLGLFKKRGYRQVTLFASGLGEIEVAAFSEWLRNQPLDHLAVFHLAKGPAKLLVEALPEGLKGLNLTGGSLTGSSIGEKVKNLHGLELESGLRPHFFCGAGSLLPFVSSATPVTLTY